MEDDKGRRYRSGDGAQFSSKKCPSGPGLETSCELPFGFVITPMAPYNKENVSVVDCKSEALPPVLCLSCLTYINLYAKLHPSKNVWECPLCGSDENVLDPKLIEQGGLLSSALSTPVVEFRQNVYKADSEEALTSCTYILVLDSNLSRDDATAVATAIQTICTNTSEDNDTEVKIGMIVFDKGVAMYQLGLASGIASADSCTIKQANSDEHLANRRSHIQKRPYLATIRPGRTDDFSSMWRCISAVYGTTLSGDDGDEVSESISPVKMSRLDKLRQRKEVRERDAAIKNASPVPRESPWIRARNKASSAHPSRCTGEAIQCAIDLATIGQTKSPGRSQILLFTNGCPNLGDGSVVDPEKGAKKPRRSLSSSAMHKPDVIEEERLITAVQYFEKLAEVGQEHEVGIDVFCTGEYKTSAEKFERDGPQYF